MRNKFLIGAAAALSLALVACNENTASNTGSKDRVATDSGPAVPVADPSKEGGVANTNTAPAELTAETRDYARKAAMGDLYEVEASKIALARSKSNDVKKFAQEMIDAHTRTSDELKARLARAGLIVELPTMLDMEHQKKLDELKSANAQQFDMRYLAQQKEAHEQALMLHRDYAMRGNVADLKAFAADTAPKVEKHVQMAADLQNSHRTG